MLIDKGYYDYDYEKPKEKPTQPKNYGESVRSDEEMRKILSRFGWGQSKKKQPLTPDEMQEARKKK